MKLFDIVRHALGFSGLEFSLGFRRGPEIKQRECTNYFIGPQKQYLK